MRDLPTGPALLALARDVLLNDLMPLLPPELRLDARLVANSMAIAEREAVAGRRRRRKIVGELENLLRQSTDQPPPAGPPLPRAGEVAGVRASG